MKRKYVIFCLSLWQNIYSSPLEEELVTMVTCSKTISIIRCNDSDFPVLIQDCTYTKYTPAHRFVP